MLYSRHRLLSRRRGTSTKKKKKNHLPSVGWTFLGGIIFASQEVPVESDLPLAKQQLLFTTYCVEFSHCFILPGPLLHLPGIPPSPTSLSQVFRANLIKASFVGTDRHHSKWSPLLFYIILILSNFQGNLTYFLLWTSQKPSGLFNGEVIFLIWALEEIEIKKWRALATVDCQWYGWTPSPTQGTSRPSVPPRDLGFSWTACNLISFLICSELFPTCLSFHLQEIYW